MDELPDWIRMARQQWKRQGQTRPTFATPPGPGQVSVWDFPPPPRLVQDTREVVVHWGEVEVARTHRAVLVLETSHPPSVYLPWDDVAKHLLEVAGGDRFVNGKGRQRIGAWCLAKAACPGWLGATQSRWQVPKCWPTASLFIRRIWFARSMVPE